MKRCCICNEVACHKEICKTITIHTRKRVLNQAGKFNQIVNKKIEKECKNKDCLTVIFHPKQFCEPCRIIKLNERRKKDREGRRELRICKHIDCNTNLNDFPNSKKYCSDKCRPKKQVTAKQLLTGERKSRKPKNKKQYGLNPLFTNPRGSRQRKELGLPDVTFSNNYGGYATVD